MLSIDLRQAITEFLSRSDDYQPLFELVQAISAHYHASEQHILGQSEGGTALTQAAGALQSRFSTLYSVTQTIVPRRVYKSLEAFRAGVESSFDPAAQVDPFIQGIVSAVEAFVTCYDAFLMQQTAANAAKLMLEASYLDRQLLSTLQAFNFVESALGGQQENANAAALSLVLYGATSFQSFVEKLQALQELYSELCMLLGVSEDEHPLRIGKIESGSLMARIFGEAKVMPLIAKLLESTLKYLHREFSTEGKIASVPRKLESLDAAIQMSTKLSELGVDTSEMNEHLRKSGVAIAKSLGTLLEDQPRVRVNNQMFSLESRIEPYFLAQTKALQIKDETDNAPPPRGGTLQLPGVPEE